MWKWIGVVLLLGGGGYMGLSVAGEKKRRIQALEAWETALAVLAGELAFRLPAMTQLMETLSRRSPSPAGEALSLVGTSLEKLGERPFSEIWNEAVARESTGLAAEDVAAIQGLGTFLGRCGWEEQRRAAEELRRTLAARAARLRQEERQEGKVYCTLGLSLAAFVAILLL